MSDIRTRTKMKRRRETNTGLVEKHRILSVFFKNAHSIFIRWCSAASPSTSAWRTCSVWGAFCRCQDQASCPTCSLRDSRTDSGTFLVANPFFLMLNNVIKQRFLRTHNLVDCYQCMEVTTYLTMPRPADDAYRRNMRPCKEQRACHTAIEVNIMLNYCM